MVATTTVYSTPLFDEYGICRSAAERASRKNRILGGDSCLRPIYSMRVELTVCYQSAVRDQEVVPETEKERATMSLRYIRYQLYLGLLAGTVAWAAQTAAAGEADGRLDIYWTDVEGGAATLIVTPVGESILIDAGLRGERGPRTDPRDHHEEGRSQAAGPFSRHPF